MSVDYYNPHTLFGNVKRAAIEAEGSFHRVPLEGHFAEYEGFYIDLFRDLAYTYGHIALSSAETLAASSESLRKEADGASFRTKVEVIREDAISNWEGDGADSFSAYLDTIENALQYQYEASATLEHLLRLHGSLVRSAKEKIIYIAEQTVEELEDRQQRRKAEEGARLRSLRDNIVNGAAIGVTVGGPWGIVAGVATGVGGYVVDENTRMVVGDDAYDILGDMTRSLVDVYEEFYTGEAGIWTGLTKLLEAHLTPGGDSVAGSPLTIRYLSEYLHGDEDPNEVYNSNEWVTF